MPNSESSIESSSILTYLRVRPTKSPSNFFSQDREDPNRLRFNIPIDLKSGELVNNTRTRYDFKFSGVFNENSNQEEVFNIVGRDAVLNILNGYNSTVFAYGQTGSGKTFTVTGGAERYVDRGIIPRCLNLLYAEFKKRSDMQYTCYVSYLEIYNEQGYDLLDPSHNAKSLDDLPKVTLMEDDYSNIHLKNLSMYASLNEEEALNYLFIGDTNRAISETAMNKASSRSHCIFTISIEGRKTGGDRVMRSKLHLVDLAGSERVHKTNAIGQVLTEAKYINTSLFYLEMVIVALHEKAKGRTHIPYRNSMMTSVLRDSLGGNCKTIMIATINPELAHTDESISTCRFAQRVSLIKNTAVINEVIDPELMIRKLKLEIEGLKEELSFYKAESGEEEILLPKDITVLESNCNEYIHNSDCTQELRIGSFTVPRIRKCFLILKNLVIETMRAPKKDENSIDLLNRMLSEKDAEIEILVNMIKQGKKSPTGSNQIDSVQNSTSQLTENLKKSEYERKWSGIPLPRTLSILDDPQLSFQHFCTYFPPNRAIEENKQILQEKYSTAKKVGARVNQARSSINYLKKTIEQIRRERAIEGFIDRRDEYKENFELCDEDPEELKLKSAIEVEKNAYKSGFQELRDLKSEIERIQKLVEKGREKLQSNFDLWYYDVSNEFENPENFRVNSSKAESRESLDEMSAKLKLKEDQTAEDIKAFYRASKELLAKRETRNSPKSTI